MAVITSGPGTLYVGSTTGSTWQGWNQVYVTSTTTNIAWGNWNEGWYNLGTTTGSTTWIQWNTSYAPPAVLAPADETEEQRLERERLVMADWERQRQRQQEQIEESRRQAETARQHAEELLLVLLSDEQAASWREHDYFFVRGSRTGRTYRISRGIAHNVNLIAEYSDEAEVNYCAHPPGVPAEDVCLAQMFLLATDEDAFLRVANFRTLRQPERRLQAVA